MSRRIDARGATFEEALTAALAELLDCRTDDVDVRVSAAGIDELTGTLELELTLAAEAEPEDDRPAPAAHPEDEAAEADEVAESSDDRDEDAEAEDQEEAEDDAEQITLEDLDEEADAAADFLEGLLDAMDLPGDLRIKVHDDHAEVEVLEVGSGALIGRRGQTLEAIQELVRCALQRQFQRRCRVKVDAEGYRSRRLEKLLEKAETAIGEALETGEVQKLEPMDVFERKAVHHLVAEHEGVASRSQGREPARRVMIEPE